MLRLYHAYVTITHGVAFIRGTIMKIDFKPHPLLIELGLLQEKVEIMEKQLALNASAMHGMFETLKEMEKAIGLLGQAVFDDEVSDDSDE